jgi:hypothetical protein
VQAASPLAEAASGTQQPDPQPQPAGGGGGKKDKERQRKERQRLRRLQEVREMLDVAMEAMEQTGVRCVHTLHPLPVPHASVTLVCVLTIREGRVCFAARAQCVR